MNFADSALARAGELVCSKKNNFYAQCLFEARAERNKANFGWDGTALECGDEVSTPDEDMPARRLLDAVDTTMADEMAGDEMDGGYGERMTPMSYGDGSCDVCASEWYQCGGGDLAYTACCEEGLECVQKNAHYAQCLGPGRAADNVANEGWDGIVLDCGSLMPSDMAPAPAPARRLLQTGTYGSYSGAAYGAYGSYGGYGAYGSRATPAGYGNGACDVCLGPYFQCGGGSLEVTACCAPGLACIKKNDDYAQCLAPEDAARNSDWDGSELACGSALAPPARRLLDAEDDAVAPGDDAMAAYADDMDGSYGSPATPAFYGNGDCDLCVGEYYQCGGGLLEMTACCAPGLECVQKNAWYAQCLGPERAAANIETEGWDGDVLQCGSLMPSDMMPAQAPAMAPTGGRRLQQAGAYGGSSYGGSSYGGSSYGGSYGAYGRYGAARGYGY